MAQPCLSACTVWASEEDLCSPCDDYTFDVGLFDEMLPIASDVLYELSGKQFPGACQDLVRPCSSRSPCGCHSGGCSCHHPFELALGVYPLTSIVSITQADNTNPVWLNGAGTATLDPSLYRIDDYRWLVRQPNPDGSNPGWPGCQRLDKPSGEADTFEVTFTYGQSPPAAGVRAAAAMACQLALACNPEATGQCKLPQRIQTITRQGVTMAMLDPFDFLDRGLTGVYEVDLFLRTYNPNGLRRRAAVMSPDIRRRARRANT